MGSGRRGLPLRGGRGRPLPSVLNGAVGREDGPEKMPTGFDDLGIISGL